MRFWLGMLAIGMVAGCGGGDEGGGSSKGSGGVATGGSGGSGASGGSGGSAGSAGTAGTPAGGSGGGGGSAGSVACNGATDLCVADAPLNWTGPVAFYVGSGSAPACPAAWPEKGASQHASLEEGAASCSCTCADPTGISCVGSAKIGKTISCIVASQGTSLTANQCTAGSYTKGYWDITLPTPNGGTCTPQPTTVLPTASWKEDAHRCGGVTSAPSADCPTGTQCAPIVPAPYKTCVWRPGDQACPTAYYSEKFLTYDDFSDTRACSACTCDAPSGKSCGEVNFATGCTIFSQLVGSGTTCVNLPSDASYVTYKLAPTGTCAPKGGTLSGSVTKNGEITYCCAK